jgi:DNA-binding Lrp family transcriptional regulator
MENKQELKVLSYLDQNSRVPLTTIAKDMKISPQKLKYHFDKLVKSGVILDFWPTIDFRKLGYINISYFFKLKNLSQEVENKLAEYINEANDINIAMYGDGFWDLHITFSTKNIFLNQEAFEKFYEKFNSNISHYDTALPVGFYQFPRKYLLGNSKPIVSGLTGSDTDVIQISDIQRKILNLLNQDARLPYNDISNKIAVSRQTVVKNISDLEKDGVVQSYTILPNHEKLNILFYRTLIKIKNFNPKRHVELLRYCREHSNIVSFLKLVGNWQLLLDIEVSSVVDIRNMSKELREKFADMIDVVEPTLVFKIQKFRDTPKEI